MTEAATGRFAFKNRWIVTVGVASVISGLFVMALVSPHYHLAELWFSPFALASGVAALLDVALLIYFLRKSARTEDRIWLAVFLLLATIYVATECLQRASATPVASLFWSNASTIALLYAPAIYLFTLAYTNTGEKRYPGIVAFSLASAACLIFFENWTDIIFVNDTKLAQLMPWGWDYRATLAAGVYLTLLWWYVFMFASIFRLAGFRRHTRNPVLRRQSLIFIVAVSIPVFGGAITDILLPAVGVTSVPALSGLMTVPMSLLLIYGVLRYQLLTVSPAQFSNTILDIMQEAVVVTDSKFNIMYVNPEAEKNLGLSAKASDGVVLTTKIAEGMRSSFDQAFAENADSNAGTVDIERIDIVRPHGDPLPMRVRASSLSLGGSLRVFVIILTDITKELQTRGVIEREVKERTSELNQARAYLVSSINSLEQGFILLNPHGQIELANGVAAASAEQNPAELRGKDIRDYANPLKWDVKLGESAHRVLESKRASQLKASAADGTFYVVYITPILEDDRVLGATVVVEDVTEAKILERSKDEFFSIASHELRTPLTAIRGNMSIAKQYFADTLKDETFASLINDTHDASVRLIAIVNDFLDSSKLEQGKMQFDLRPVAVGPIISAVQKDLETLLASQKDTLEVTDLDKLPNVMVDEARFRQVIYNLLSNAIKYTTEGRITVTADADKHDLHIHVTDTGKGISPENQKLLFHKFQQAGSSILTRDNTKGTGLGLYISRLLANNMHGDVQMEHTEAGKGSTFAVTVPLAASKPVSHK